MEYKNIPSSAYTAPINQSLVMNGRVVMWAYAALWPALAYIGNYFSRPDSYLAWLFWAFILLLTAIRVRLAERLLIDDPQIWYRRYCLIVLFNVSVWSLAMTVVILHEGLDGVAYIWLIVNAGLVAGGVSTMAVTPNLAVAYQTILLLPVFILWGIAGERLTTAISACSFVFWVQMIVIAKNQGRMHRQYLTEHFTLEAYAERLKVVSEEDSLTGLANRRQFEAVLNSEWDRIRRTNGCLALLMIDLDYFKSINDTYGHQIGDKCLVKVGEILTQHVHRSADQLARYGGEEFVVLLPDTDIEGGRAVAETLRAAMACQALLLGELQIPVTLSIGVAAVRPKNESTSSVLLKRADQALYDAKAKGRNRVECDYSVGHTSAQLSVERKI